MSLDFAITQFYRLVVDDLILMYDVYLFYSRYKKSNRSIREYSEVLANLMEVEAQNFEDIDETKLSHDSEERVEWMIRDYLMSVVVRYVLDDLSQFPYWSAKIMILSSNDVKPFGKPLINDFWNYLEDKIKNRQLKTLYEGVGPYLCASFIINFDYISKSTHNFIIAMLSKIPRPPPKPPSQQTITNDSNNSPIKLPKINIPATIQTLKGSPGKNKKDKPSSTTSRILDTLKNIVIETLSNPFLVLSISMVSDPLLRGDPWLYAYVKFVKNYGIQAFYHGLRTRIMFTLLPISPILLLGVNDTLIYRKMLDHRVNISESVFTVARELTQSSTVTNSSVNSNNSISNNNNQQSSLFSYGLLTAVHILPGFVSLVGMRLAAWLLFGSSNHRKHQIYRRKEIVQAHILKLKKRSSKTGLSPKFNLSP